MTEPDPLAAAPAGFAARNLARLRTYHASAPVASATGMYAVLAGVRVAGAFAVPLMVISVSLSALVLAVVPRARWASVGIRRFAPRPALVGIALTLVAYAIAALGTRAAFGRGQDNWIALAPGLFRQMAPGTPWLYVLIMMSSMVVLVPLVEEICYRGVLYSAVEQRWGDLTATVSTSAAWTLVHLGDYGLNPLNVKVICGMLPSVFLMGLALGACRALTGSALACVLAQGTANLPLIIWATWLL